MPKFILVPYIPAMPGTKGPETVLPPLADEGVLVVVTADDKAGAIKWARDFDSAFMNYRAHRLPD